MARGGKKSQRHTDSQPSASVKIRGDQPCLGPHETQRSSTKVSTTNKSGKTKSNMSHTVTITRTTTTTSTSAIIVNTGYLKTFPGILKLIEVIVSGVVLGLICYYKPKSYHYDFQMPADFMLAVITAVFIGSFCLLLSCLISLATASFISKTIYELVYHFIAMVLTLAASITLLVVVNRYSSRSTQEFFISSILGLILSALYLISTVLAFRAYRGA